METARGLPSLRALQDPPVSGKLSRVVEVGKGAAAPSREGFADQIVGDVRVLRQQRAVHVGADDAPLHRPFGLVGAVVAFSPEDLAQRFGVRAEKGASAVVLES